MFLASAANRHEHSVKVKHSETIKTSDTMSDKEKKMERLKKHLIKIHGKIHDRMEEFQDQVQTKIENSKISRFVSHLSDDKSSFDESSIEDKDAAVDKVSINSTEDIVKKEFKSNSIPSVVIDTPIDTNIADQDAKEICIDFLNTEKNLVLYNRRSLSATNLAYDDDSNFDSSSDSCFSCMSSSDERYCFFLFLTNLDNYSSYSVHY